MKRRQNLQLVRCSRCHVTLYAKPNGITPGDRCNADVIAEWHQWQGLLMTACFGTFELLGKLIAA